MDRCIQLSLLAVKGYSGSVERHFIHLQKAIEKNAVDRSTIHPCTAQRMPEELEIGDFGQLGGREEGPSLAAAIHSTIKLPREVSDHGMDAEEEEE